MSAGQAFRILVAGDEPDFNRVRSALVSEPGRFEIQFDSNDEDPASRTEAARHDVIVVGSTLQNPLTSAQELRKLSPAAEVLFLLPPERLARFRAALGFVSHLGSAWTIGTDSSDSALRDMLAEAARSARSRAAAAATYGRINLQLATSRRPSEGEARRARLAISERYLATILSQSPDAFLAVDRKAELIAWNEAAKRLFGLGTEDALGMPAVELFPDRYRAEIAALIDDAQHARSNLQREVQLGTPSRPVTAEISFAPVHDDVGAVASVSITARDVSARKRAEDELRELNQTLEQRIATAIAEREEAELAFRQAQKMEAIGQLTGGIAHDFNNLLQIITGNLETLSRNLPEDASRLRRAANNAMAGAQRAALLTQRLLAFSRRQPLAPKPINVNNLVRDTSELLHRALGERIELETVLTPQVWTVEADPNQLESALLNLAVNARDAMPEGGKLTIETSNTILEASVGTETEVLPGQYVVISVSDTGVGMDRDMVARVFEPFFTTKEAGKGTGLGLSQVYGFVKQSGGNVKIYSEPGRGTTVRVNLPRRADAAFAEKPSERQAPERTGSETVLVVEDDEDVRAYSVEVLSELGYGILQARDATAAISVLEGTERVDLLFTDMVLPGPMSGADLAEAACVLQPDLKVLFTTGYARNAVVHHGRLAVGVNLITKPFSYAELAARVRDVLDSR